MSGIRNGPPTFVGLRLVTEWVECKWRPVYRVDDADRLLQAIDRKDGNERAEGFVNDHRIVNIIDLNNSNVNETVLLVHLSANQDLAGSIIKHLLDPL